MAKRHKDALFIQEGACNPSGIAHSIVDACREIRSEPKHAGTAQITSDPAIKLMVHQLAFICGVTTGAEGMANEPTWDQCMEACRMHDQKDKLVPMNAAQLDALHKVYSRAPIEENGRCITFDEFRSKVMPGPGCVMVPWAGMVLGIEPDGYTHS